MTTRMAAGIPTDAVAIAAMLAARPERPLLVGLTGSVAVGKTALAAALASALAPAVTVAQVATDGFLHPNAILETRGLVLKKGFPESFDADALFSALASLRTGPTTVPVHSHASYDIDPALARRVDPAEIILVEGLGLSGFPDGRSARSALDVLIYLDADPADVARWYVARFIALWRAGADDPGSFYHRFAALPEAQVVALAEATWTNINLPNLVGHIAAARATADIRLHKTAEHHLLLCAD
jgi:type I pantothenate kinase